MKMAFNDNLLKNSKSAANGLFDSDRRPLLPRSLHLSLQPYPPAAAYYVHDRRSLGKHLLPSTSVFSPRQASVHQAPSHTGSSGHYIALPPRGTTYTLLPKLAVSAKLLICLLMVVSCESKSLVARSVRLYNQCTSSMLRVNMTGAVAADNSEDGFENLVIESTDFSGKLIIYGELTKRYLCFNPRWKLIGSRRFRGALCTFTEETTSGGYYRYRSVQDKSKYLGFTKSGRQLRGRNSSPACLNWVKLDSKFSIPEHNELIRGTPRVSLEAINREMMAGDGAERAGRRRHRHRKHRLHRNN